MPIDPKLFEKAAAMAKRSTIDMPNGTDVFMDGVPGQPQPDAAMPGGTASFASDGGPELAGPPVAGMGSPVGPPVAGMGSPVGPPLAGMGSMAGPPREAMGGGAGGDGLGALLAQYATPRNLALGGGAVGLGALAAYLARRRRQRPEEKAASVAAYLGHRAASLTRK